MIFAKVYLWNHLGVSNDGRFISNIIFILNNLPILKLGLRFICFIFESSIHLFIKPFYHYLKFVFYIVDGLKHFLIDGFFYLSHLI